MVTRKYLVLLSSTGLIVSLDQLTKNAVVSRLHVGESIPLLQSFFGITRVHNSGVAFGFLSSLPSEFRDPVFLLVPGTTLAVIFAIFYRLRESQSLSAYALSMIVGGAFGNLADRIRLGFVVDFLDFHWRNVWHFPAFNLADSAITFGVGLLLFGMIAEKEAELAPPITT